MKKIGMIMLSLMLVALTGFAQPGQRNMDPEDMAKRQTAQIKEAVGLDAKQEKQVYDLNLESGKKMQAMRESQGGNFEAMREKMTEMRAEQDKKMKTILTAAQWKKYEKYQEERRSQRGQGGGSWRN
jgi:periplasmic protein CpxP/Spy